MKRGTEVRAEACLESLWKLAPSLCLRACLWDRGRDASLQWDSCAGGGQGRLGTAASFAWCPAVVPRGITWCREGYGWVPVWSVRCVITSRPHNHPVPQFYDLQNQNNNSLLMG